MKDALLGFVCDTCGMTALEITREWHAANPAFACPSAPMFESKYVPSDQDEIMRLTHENRRLEKLLVEQGNVANLKKQYHLASRKLGKQKKVIANLRAFKHWELERINLLAEEDEARIYSESEFFVAEYITQKGALHLNDDATVYGVTLHHLVTMLRDYATYPDWDRERGSYTITLADRPNSDEVYHNAARIVDMVATPPMQDYARRVVHQVLQLQLPHNIIIRDLRRQLAALQVKAIPSISLPGGYEFFAVDYFKRDPDGQVTRCRRPIVDRPEWVTEFQKNLPNESNLSVTKILLDVVPGKDGMGEEVYAKSLDDVRQTLTAMGEKIEELTKERDGLQRELTKYIGWYNDCEQTKVNQARILKGGPQ